MYVQMCIFVFIVFINAKTKRKRLSLRSYVNEFLQRYIKTMYTYICA